MSATPQAALAPASGLRLESLHHWPRDLLSMLDHEASAVRVLVASLRGSAPREPGAIMLIGRERLVGTIGGGHLEWKAIAAARSMLADSAPAGQLKRYVLGLELGQCCGGVVELWIERYGREDRALLQALSQDAQPLMLKSELSNGSLRRWIENAGPKASPPSLRLLRGVISTTVEEPIAPPHPSVWLFGAGHVGQAIARLLADLPLQLSWIDSRPDLFPVETARHVEQRVIADPAASVANAPPGTRFLILTHDHALDYAICRAVLARGDFAFAGVIGSASKAARFRSRLACEDGFAADQIERLSCPIGIDGIASKWPAAIAVAVAAQLLQSLPAAESRISAKSSMTAAEAHGCSESRCSTCQPNRPTP